MDEDRISVYYGQNFWGAPHGRPADETTVNWRFSFNGKECCIPKLYSSEEGLTMDILVFLERDSLRSFSRKYSGLDSESLSPAQQQMIESDHPVPELSFTLRLINGLSTEAGIFASSFVHVPLAQGDHVDETAEAVCRAYKSFTLSQDCFVCWRIHTPWPEGKRLCVEDISLEMMELPRCYPLGKKFTLSEDSFDGRIISFRHPHSGEEHTLYVNDFTFLHRGPTPHLPQIEEGWIPVFSYEIVPPLGTDESAVIMENGMPPVETDGPVSVGFEDPLPGPHGTKQQAANGWLHPQRGGEVSAVLIGIQSRHGLSMRYSFRR